MKKKQLNLTSGPILRTLSELALPIMASSFLSTAYNITDMAWIGMLGSKAVAGVGVGGMYVWLSQGLSRAEISHQRDCFRPLGCGADVTESGGAWFYDGAVRAGLQRYVTAYQGTDETDSGTDACTQRTSCFKVDDGQHLYSP